MEPGLHIIVTIAEHACDHVLKRVLKLSTYRLQTFLVKYVHLRSLQLCEDQVICGKLKIRCFQTCLRSLRLIWKPGLNSVCSAVEGHCLEALKIVHHHPNGHFDWQIPGNQSVDPSREPISLPSGKQKRLTFVHPMSGIKILI